MKSKVCVLVVFLLGMLAISQGKAQTYPSKPIRLIVPYAAGGGTDISERVIAHHMSESMGQPVIVDNKPGGGTLLGTAIVAKAAPDGYALVLGTIAHTIAPALYKEKMPFNVLSDFTPITQIAVFPFVVLANSTSTITSVGDLIAKARNNPGKLNYASVGKGTGTNLSGEMFKLLTSTSLVHVPYNGSGPALNALLGSQVDVAITDPAPAIPLIKSGTLRALAVTTIKRASSMPEVPTLAEAGVSGFEFTSWWGVFGPAGMSSAVVQRLNKEFAKALQQPEVRAKLASFSADPVGNSPAEFDSIVKSEVAKFENIVSASKIIVD